MATNVNQYGIAPEEMSAELTYLLSSRSILNIFPERALLKMKNHELRTACEHFEIDVTTDTKKEIMVENLLERQKLILEVGGFVCAAVEFTSSSSRKFGRLRVELNE